MEEVYKMLAKNKRKDESFSDAIRRVLAKKKNFIEFAGAWELSEEDHGKMTKAVKKFDQKLTEEVIYNGKSK